jgi:hypothetical protein
MGKRQERNKGIKGIQKQKYGDEVKGTEECQ